MFCGSDSGDILPPYITCGTGGCKDWFDHFFVPYVRRLDGPKILIADNLLSHFTIGVLQSAKQHNIRFICLAPNATHLCQPLDVAYFVPLKRAWCDILAEYKIANPRDSYLNKESFPRLLKQLTETIAERGSENIKRGFEACRISPFDPSRVLQMLPGFKENDDDDVSTCLNDLVLNMLETMRYTKLNNATGGKRTPLNVVPGRSVEMPANDVVDEPPTTLKNLQKRGRPAENEEESGDSSSSSSSSDKEDVEPDDRILKECPYAEKSKQKGEKIP
uniref:DDE-1 domain-containing protein n=1 Tax=Romanomermis culicivorax TaxID=13658 RepID=A0A915IH04_ROMCU